MTNQRWMYRLGAATATVAALAACSEGGSPAAETRAQPVNEPLAATYDGGLYVLDGDTLEVRQDISLDGFLRVNPAGDDAHVLVTTADGFRVLDAAGGQLTDQTFAAAEPGHVVPHHGVAVILADGTLLHSIGDPDRRVGAVALDGGRETARSEDCPGIHGETVVADETVIFGCENGALEYANGTFTKIAVPTPYGRIGTAKGHEDSPVALADMKIDPDAELERPGQFALIDTATDSLQVVQLPPAVSYSFRSLARGPQAEALILGTDGMLHVFDPVTAKPVKTIRVTDPWTEPDDWQEPRPTVFTRDDAVYVTDPASRQLHLVDLQGGAITASATLDEAPNELSGAVGHDH
jgi:hypothetical protein